MRSGLPRARRSDPSRDPRAPEPPSQVGQLARGPAPRHRRGDRPAPSSPGGERPHPHRESGARPLVRDASRGAASGGALDRATPGRVGRAVRSAGAHPRRGKGRMMKTIHGSFAIDRAYRAPPERVFAAWADLETKARWFIGPEGKWKLRRRELDFRVGGQEVLGGEFHGGGRTPRFLPGTPAPKPAPRLV